jgi:hypothetical protein
MVRITDLKIGNMYDFQNIALQAGSHEGYLENGGYGNWSGWLLGITPNDDEISWTCAFKDNDGCDLYISVGPGYNEFYQRPEAQKRGDDLTNVLSWVCNLDENSNNENEDENDEENENENENENEYSQRRWGGGRKTRKQKRKSRKSKKTRSRRRN